MKTVTVRYFAVFREATGVDTETIATEAATLRELFGEMAGRHAALVAEASALVAVNDEMSSWDKPVGDGDEVLFFPPVAGG